MKFLLLAMLAMTFGIAHAQWVPSAQTAQAGTVLDVQEAPIAPGEDGSAFMAATPAVATACDGGYASHKRAVIGGAIGGIVGLLAGRHSDYGWEATAAGTAIGSAVGASRDAAACQQQVAMQRSSTYAEEVVVKLATGSVVAVRATTQQFYPGQSVYVLGGGGIIPAR